MELFLLGSFAIGAVILVTVLLFYRAIDYSATLALKRYFVAKRDNEGYSAVEVSLGLQLLHWDKIPWHLRWLCWREHYHDAEKQRMKVLNRFTSEHFAHTPAMVTESHQG